MGSEMCIRDRSYGRKKIAAKYFAYASTPCKLARHGLFYTSIKVDCLDEGHTVEDRVGLQTRSASASNRKQLAVQFLPKWRVSKRLTEINYVHIHWGLEN